MHMHATSVSYLESFADFPQSVPQLKSNLLTPCFSIGMRICFAVDDGKYLFGVGTRDGSIRDFVVSSL